MARTYKRDSRGRFAGGGGSSSSRPPARQVSRGANRLTRDNAGRITSVGGNGATARGGRLRTAAGNLRATQTTRLSGGGGRLRGGKGNAASLEDRKIANAVRRGVRRYATDADRRFHMQKRAQYQAKVEEYARNPPHDVFGINRNAITMAKADLSRYAGAPPKSYKINTTSTWMAAQDRLTAKRAEKRQRKYNRRADTLRKAVDYYRATGTLPASMRKQTRKRRTRKA